MNTTQRIAAIPGQGLVHRDGDTILVVGGSQQPDAALATGLIATMSDADADAGLRTLARLLVNQDSPPPVAVVRIDGATASVFLFGAFDLVTPSDRLSATGTVLGLNETVDLAAGLAVVAAGKDAPDMPGWVSLGAGAVAGSGVVVFPEAGEVDEGGSDEVTEPSADFEVIDIGSESADEPEAREPLPIAEPEPESAPDPAPLAGETPPAAHRGPKYEHPVEVLGVMSPRGFFNHPEAKYCSRSGVKMGASHTLVLTHGPRPPLGVITFEDGSTYTVQWNTVIGRDPSVDETVQSHSSCPLVITDDTQSVSRRHIFLELVDWDVLVSDLGSQNGTLVKSGDGEERLLGSGERMVMRTGTSVRLGNRSFVYNEHHVR